MTAPKKILVADDDQSIRTVLRHALGGAGYDVECADNAVALYELAAAGKGDLVITDVRMPGISGLELIPRLRARRPDLQVIVISAQNVLTTAIAASERGALEFLPKPFDIDELLLMVHNALAKTPAPANASLPGDDVAHAIDRNFVLGQSRAMQEIYRTVARLRESDLTVLITGESGTGKEVIARALHAYSRWKAGPFIAVNMAAIPRDLIESELFGHEKGAFTGATQRQIGRFEQAAGGTLFLDEIGDMPMEAQTRLLRVLQEGEFNTVGGRRPIKTSVRIVAASHRDLASLIREGRFRQDLFYRLNVVPLRIPPLRDRPDDIVPLCQHFLNGSGKVLSASAAKILSLHNWPGNIRELENMMKRAAVMTTRETVDEAMIADLLSGGDHTTIITSHDLSALIEASIAPAHHFGRVYEAVISAVEKPLLIKAMSLTNGNQIKAAALLGLNRNTLRTKLRALAIQREDWTEKRGVA